MTNQIDSGLGGFQNQIADERLVSTVRRMHVDEKHLAEDRPESVDLNSHRPTHFALHHILSGGLNLNYIEGFQWS